MRLKLTLRSAPRECSIPLSYQYYLSSAIYQLLEKSSPEYSENLHNGKIGNAIEGHKKFKHFCFSQLYAEDAQVKDGRLILRRRNVTWYVGMAIEETMRHFVIGLFDRQKFYIGSTENEFLIEQVELLPEPSWQLTMRFRALSPITVSVPVKRFGKLQARYFLADDPQLSEALRTNIIARYKALYNTLPDNLAFFVKPDAKYIEERGGSMRVSKLVTIKEGTADETKVRGFLCPLAIEGNTELIKLAYDSGLGEKGSMGFGMIEEI